TPRFLVQGDQTRFLTIVHNDTAADCKATVRLVAPSLGLQTTGAADTQSVTVKSGEDTTVSWPLLARVPGDAALRVTAWTTDSSPQYTDGLEKSLPIRAWGRTQSTALAGVLDGASASNQRPFTIDPLAVPEATRLVVRVTPSLSGAMT